MKSRAKAIKTYCKDQCCNKDMESWRNCSVTSCPLWPFRMGRAFRGNTTSFRKKQGEIRGLEQKEAIVEPTSSHIQEVLI